MTKDTRRLRDAYGRGQVVEYWLIDARGPAIGFEILSNTGGRMLASGAPDGPQASQVLGGRWRLTRTRNKAGRFQYTLAIA